MQRYSDALSGFFNHYTLQSQPFIVLKVESDISQSMNWIEKYRKYIEDHYSYHLTITTLCIYAIYKSYEKYQDFGARIENNCLIKPSRFNIGLVVCVGDDPTQVGILDLNVKDCFSIAGIGRKIVEGTKRLQRIYSSEHILSDKVMERLEKIDTKKLNNSPKIIINSINADGVDLVSPFLPIGIGQSFSIGRISTVSNKKILNIYCSFHPSACYGKVGMEFMGNIKRILENADYIFE